MLPIWVSKGGVLIGYKKKWRNWLTIVRVQDVITCWTAQGVLKMIKTKDIAAQDLEVSSQIFLFAMIFWRKKKYYWIYKERKKKECNLLVWPCDQYDPH